MVAEFEKFEQYSPIENRAYRGCYSYVAVGVGFNMSSVSCYMTVRMIRGRDEYTLG